MMMIVRKYITSDSFEDTRARYSEFPKISFDYEVAEKVQSVAVVPFNGEWKGLDTWNTLTDELRTSVIGNAVMARIVRIRMLSTNSKILFMWMVLRMLLSLLARMAL